MSSLGRVVLINNSCLAPPLSAMAFHPLLVGTVTRIVGSPLASRTGRITPGITERISLLSFNNRSSTGLNPSMMLCSIFSFPWTARSLMSPSVGYGRMQFLKPLDSARSTNPDTQTSFPHFALSSKKEELMPNNAPRLHTPGREDAHALLPHCPCGSNFDDLQDANSMRRHDA